MATLQERDELRRVARLRDHLVRGRVLLHEGVESLHSALLRLAIPVDEQLDEQLREHHLVCLVIETQRGECAGRMFSGARGAHPKKGDERRVAEPEHGLDLGGFGERPDRARHLGLNTLVVARLDQIAELTHGAEVDDGLLVGQVAARDLHERAGRVARHIRRARLEQLHDRLDAAHPRDGILVVAIVASELCKRRHALRLCCSAP